MTDTDTDTDAVSYAELQRRALLAGVDATQSIPELRRALAAGA